MPLELVRAQPEHVSELGRIAYEAFKDVADKHHMPLPPGFSARQQRQGLTRMVSRETMYGLAALMEGEPAGGAFIETRTEVGAVGPVFVEVPFQGQGVGRAMMEDILYYAQRNSVERVRLMQESHNVISLSLYASLGFDLKDVIVRMEAGPSQQADESIRELAEEDLPAISELSKRLYKVDRRNEVAAVLALGGQPIASGLPSPVLLAREENGVIRGYVGAGHGAAETTGDALALLGEAARRRAPARYAFNCPLSQADLYRGALKAGGKGLEVMNLMSIGPYEPPSGVWMPSQFY